MCGSTSAQNNILKQQQSLYQQMGQQSQQVFGNSSSVFNDLQSSLAPTVAAGPGQEGFTAPEKAAMNSQAITETGQAYKNANQAIKENEAAQGGGNMVLPSGTNTARDIGTANAAAGQTASELNQIQQADYATGRQNYFQAVNDLNQAPNVFNPATSMANAATGSGEAAANTANQIAQENQSWVNSVTGALGGIAGSFASGGMSNLGKGVGFFGQNAPPPGQ